MKKNWKTCKFWHHKKQRWGIFQPVLFFLISHSKKFTPSKLKLSSIVRHHFRILTAAAKSQRVNQLSSFSHHRLLIIEDSSNDDGFPSRLDHISIRENSCQSRHCYTNQLRKVEQLKAKEKQPHKLSIWNKEGKVLKHSICQKHTFFLQLVPFLTCFKSYKLSQMVTSLFLLVLFVSFSVNWNSSTESFACLSSSYSTIATDTLLFLIFLLIIKNYCYYYYYYLF